MTSREGARIGLNEVALGLRFPPLTFAMVKARLTAPALERVVLEAGLYDAAGARSLGLVDVVGEEALAQTMIAKLASHPSEVYAATKLLLRPRLTTSAAERQAFREETIPYWASPERRAAMLSILEKRKS
jgi:enoyl-CoA hydratase/carnithine racemase